MATTKTMMLLIFSLITWTVVGTESTEFPASTSSSTTTLPPLLRGRHHYPPHRGLQLRKKPKTDSSGSQESTYQGCLGYSESELSQSWIFSGDAPNCSWTHSTGGSSSNSGGSGSGSGSNSTRDCDNESSYDGEGDKYGGGWDDDSSDGSNNANDDNVNDDGGGNGDDDVSDGNDDASGNQASTDDQNVVTNEEVYTDDDQYDPIDDFDIEVCDTYANLWLWDLALSCDNITQEDDLFSENAGCSCEFAQELMENELLGCQDVSLCPGDCRICSICLNLLGCGDEPFIPRVFRSLSALSVLYIVGAAVGLLFFGVVAHYSRKHWNGRNHNEDLDKNLLDTKQEKVSPSMLYMHEGDLAWKPLPSDQEYAASQQSMSLQPTGTMSTASTGKASRNKKKSIRVQSIASGTLEDLFAPPAPSPQAESTTAVPSMVDTFRHDDSNITLGISPIQTLEESSEDEEDNNECEDEFDDDNECDDEFDDEDPVFEDLSPRTMSSTGENENEENDKNNENEENNGVV